MALPKVSVVIPTYNVARWLPEFLTSLDAQTGGLHGYELIFVDDGSPDESAALVSAWIARSQCDARLVTKENGGLSSARNAGLAVAGGEWVTFWDPDDKLSPPYATEIREFVESPAAAEVDLIVGRLVKFAESTGRRSTHPLDHRFARGDRVIDLESEPDAFHLAANTAFYRTARLAEHGLEFDSRIVPTFEDGHLTGRYLSKAARPRVAVRSRARYLYRRRADQSSLVQAGWQKESKYLAQPRYGWLDLLQSVRADRGRVPAWAQYMVLYEIGWYLRSEEMAPSRTAWVGPELSAGFHEILGEVAALLDPENIEHFAHSGSDTPPDLIPALLIGAKGLAGRPTHVTVDQIDAGRRLARLRYYCAAEPTDEVFEVAGRQVRPVHIKTRSIALLGRPMAAERIAWVSATDTVSVALNGVRLPIRIGPVEHPRHEAAPDRTWPTLALRPPPSTGKARAPRGRRRELVHKARELKRRLPKGRAAARRMVEDFAARKVATAAPARRAFHDAWLLMDEPKTAGGDAEALYRHLSKEHSEVNVWFVLRRDSADWDRLAKDGFRLLEHRGNRHRTALLNARHVVSGTAEESAVNPLDRKRFGPRRWRWTYLAAQPFDLDLANWLNPKPIDLTLPATRAEYDSVVVDGSRYRHCSAEVAVVGRPSRDPLWRAAASAAGDRRTVLFVPAVRQTPWTKPASFGDAAAAQAWSALLGAERLHKAATAAGYQLAVLLHPDEAAAVAVPEHVIVHRHGEAKASDLIVGCAAFVTDRSSLVHEAGYLGRPVVLCRFDDGSAVPGLAPNGGEPGDGLGPICTEPEAALDAVVGLLESGCPSPARDVEFRDGQCCERAYRAIRAGGEPAAPQDVYVP
ncbi:MAG TPA: glycosyltransferase [Sporichthyaceae bacterium]|nr:glycosyltransferase [Sporichthyaceae bacterium]